MLYFWNQETNITQYERPGEASAPQPPTNAAAPTQPSQQVMQMPYHNQYPNTAPTNTTAAGTVQQQSAPPSTAKQEQEMYNGPMGQQMAHQHVPPQQTVYSSSMTYQQGGPYMQGQPMQRPWGPQQHPYPYGQQPHQPQVSWVPPQNTPQQQISPQPGYPKPEEGAAYDNNQQMGYRAPMMVQPNQPLGGYAGPNGDDHMGRITVGNDFHPQNSYPPSQPKLAPIPCSRPVNFSFSSPWFYFNYAGQITYYWCNLVVLGSLGENIFLSFN
jgi:hypothetical protein